MVLGGPLAEQEEPGSAASQSTKPSKVNAVSFSTGWLLFLARFCLPFCAGLACGTGGKLYHQGTTALCHLALGFLTVTPLVLLTTIDPLELYNPSLTSSPAIWPDTSLLILTQGALHIKPRLKNKIWSKDHLPSRNGRSQ